MTKNKLTNENEVKNEPQNSTSETKEKVEQMIDKIENKEVDIIKNSERWKDIGFAFTDEFGADGREYFHRVSKFYPGYSAEACDKLYDNCLESANGDKSIFTFLSYAQQTNIYDQSNPENPQDPKGDHLFKTPVFDDEIFHRLPKYLKNICSYSHSERERDIMLLGSLTAISACFPNLYGIYDSKKVNANLYLFIGAPPSAGKGSLNHCKDIVYPLHSHIYNVGRNNNERRLLLLPANSSATSVFQLMNTNDGKGLLFETEGDTLTNAFNSEHGDYSDGFRKAFQHEAITYHRRTHNEYVEIPRPQLSAVLSGTPNQILKLIPNSEDGLLSRFMFYVYNITPVWFDVFKNSDNTEMEKHFSEFGKKIKSFYRRNSEAKETQFKFTEGQQQEFNRFFSEFQSEFYYVYGSNSLQVIRRLGLIFFRLALILSAVRRIEQNTPKKPKPIYCSDEDFEVVKSMIQVLKEHSKQVLQLYPKQGNIKRHKTNKENFYESLPPEFDRQGYLEIAKGLKIPDKTAQGYIKQFVDKGILDKPQHNRYRKMSSMIHDMSA